MRINQNISAMTTWRALKTTDRQTGRTMEKLSSGLRINRAADDAAGLAISERMRSQIIGLEQGVSNAQDGISLIQTAEGALDETHAILNRIRELTIQAANEVNEKGDVLKIQDEVNALIEEIDRISQTTEFNTKTLIDGNLDHLELQIGANAGQSIEIALKNMDAEALGLVEKGVNSVKFIKQEESDYSGGSGSDFEELLEEIHYGSMTSNAEEHPHFDEILTQGTEIEQSFIYEGTFYPEGSEMGEGGVNLSYGEVVYLEETEVDYDFGETATRTYYDSSGQLIIEEGEEFPSNENPGEQQTITNTEFGNLIQILDGAIDRVSEFRSELGAVQNRLEHTINNLEVARENLSAAEARIRDADMALKMMELTRHQIMKQAGTAMMAQANMRPQAILQLLG